MPKPRTQRRTTPRTSGNQTPSAPEPTDPTGPAGGARIEWLDPRDIKWPDGRITSEYDEEKSAALRLSMEQLGQQDAVGVVQLEDGTYEGAAGMNRSLAAIATGASTVQCVVRQGSHKDVVFSNLASVNQSKPNPRNEADGIANAVNNEGLSVEDVVSIVGRSPEWVEDRLQIAEASLTVKQSLEEGVITVGHATLLAEMEGHGAQEEMLQQLLAHGWTVKEMDDAISPPIPGANGAQGDGAGTRTPQQRSPRGPQTCRYCQEEYPAAEVQTLTVCNECARNVQRIPAGTVPVPIEWLKEAEPVLAATQAGAPLAERITALLEPEPAGSS